MRFVIDINFLVNRTDKKNKSKLISEIHDDLASIINNTYDPNQKVADHVKNGYNAEMMQPLLFKLGTYFGDKWSQFTRDEITVYNCVDMISEQQRKDSLSRWFKKK